MNLKFKRIIKVTKLVVTFFSVFFLVFFFLALYDTVQLSLNTEVSPLEVVVIISCIAGLISASVGIGSAVKEFRVKFRDSGETKSQKKIYGFFTVLAVGVGSTIGSPLFILIPLNIVQYEFISMGSLLIATVLSVLMAKVYSDMYVIAEEMGLESVGGPSFTRVACGKRSLRYFLSRVSMWVSNTTLAAYSKLVFLIFDLDVLPGILTGAGLGSISYSVSFGLAFVFIGWSVINAVYERKILRSVGILQIVSMIVMISVLLYHILFIGSTAGWNLSGLISQNVFSLNSLTALVINTGYLYLLFFGFQEIQALERDSLDVSNVWLPLLGKRSLNRKQYFKYAMILSVVIASVINILYGLAVFSLHPSFGELQSSSIPALYLAEKYGGSFQELLVAVAFLLASITTFVPSFVAASRHLQALCDDGYLPRYLGNISWIFTLLAIFILAVGNADFLVGITDFMVLLSLGIISLSPLWLKEYKGGRWLPFGVGLSCFVAGGAVYFISPGVVIAGLFTFMLSYTLFDIFELGLRGTQLFSVFFSLTLSFFLGIFNTHLRGGQLTGLFLPGADLGLLIQYSLIFCCLIQLIDTVTSIYISARQT
jgi:amino acid transporter